MSVMVRLPVSKRCVTSAGVRDASWHRGAGAVQGDDRHPRDVVEASVGGESNAIGIFYAFLEDPTQRPRDGDWGSCYRFRARANRRWEGENPTCEVAVAGTEGGRVPRPSTSNHVESGPDRSTQQLIHQNAAQSAPRPGSFPLQLGQMAVERSKLACRRAPARFYRSLQRLL